MEHESPEPQAHVAAHPLPATRHDGWSSEKMAIFCEALADTAVVAEACDQAGMGVSGAYALRRRDPYFAAAWDAALTIARERLADTLLARSIEGNVEQIWRDGELVGERHVIDNRLGLAILRRLDRLAETGSTVATRAERAPTAVGPGRGLSRAQTRGRGAPAPRPQPFDWERMVDALRTGDLDHMAQALALLERQGDEVEEVEDPSNSLNGQDEDEHSDPAERCWQDEDGLWMTSFAPPEGFDGYQRCAWGRYGYERACTAEEAQLLEAHMAAVEADERGKEERLRDDWFAAMRAELGEPAPLSPAGSASRAAGQPIPREAP